MTESDLRPIPTAYVGGFHTARLRRQDLASMMVSDCLASRTAKHPKRPTTVFSSNGQAIALAGRDPAFAEAMAMADIVDADGMPIVLASRLAGVSIPERCATTDFFHDAARAAEIHGLGFFLLGGTETQNRAAADAIGRKYPSLHIVGRHHGYFTESENDNVCDKIRTSGADVLWVGLGKPLEEYWCLSNREQLPTVGWIKTCGGLFAFLAGDAKRAPRWMQAIGFEWLFRMLREPRRLFWRYAVTNPLALYRILRHTNWTARETS